MQIIDKYYIDFERVQYREIILDMEHYITDYKCKKFGHNEFKRIKENPNDPSIICETC